MRQSSSGRDPAGNQLLTGGGLPGDRFDGVAGFDNPDMETSSRMVVVWDTTTRQIAQLKSQNP